MKSSDQNRFKGFESLNCEACGEEHLRKDLHAIKLSGLSSLIKICKSCKSKDPQEQYKTAASMLKDIAIIADDESSVEERLSRIKELLG